MNRRKDDVAENVGDLPVDCVAWGAFTGQAALTEYAETSVGNPADPGGITPGKALERSIAPNCPTWLEAEDDTDDSATDFNEVAPNPEPAGFYDPVHMREANLHRMLSAIARRAGDAL